MKTKETLLPLTYLPFISLSSLILMRRPPDKGDRFAAKMGFCGILGAALFKFKYKPIKTPCQSVGALRPDLTGRKTKNIKYKMTEIFHLYERRYTTIIEVDDLIQRSINKYTVDSIIPIC